jgi:hypothetical protein
MAPPTILYNNTAAKYTKYEQTDYSLVNAAEAALAKSMLSQDIDTFNTNAPQGTMDTNYSLITPAAGSSQQLSHILIHHQQTDLGSVFAIAAQHNNDETQGVASSDAPAHLSFSTTSGSMGVNLGINASGSIYVQYCPMANEGKGGYWLSSQEEIMNPYYGDDMLHCGEVKETIAKN